MQSHEVDYEILGHDMQAVEVELDPNEKVIAEAGAMNWLEGGITYEARMGDGTKLKAGFLGKMVSAAKRKIAGESVFLTHFTNEGATKSRVAFASPHPGTIVPVDLSTIPGGEIQCQRRAFLCAAFGTKVDVAFSKRLGAGFFGGEGFIMQRLSGDGMAFLHGCGAIVKKELNNETLRVDTGCLVGLTSGVDYSVELVKGFKSMLFGGEGLFLATLRGTGTVWLQTLPFSRLADQILARMPKQSNKD